MNYIRKEIIKKGSLAGFTLFTPSLIRMVYNYIKNETKRMLAFDEDSKNFEKDLNRNFEYLTKNVIWLDVLLMYHDSPENFDFVFLTNDREIDNAPCVMLPKNNDYYPDSIRRLETDVRILKQFAQKHGIFLCYNDKYVYRKLITEIKKCGAGNCIREDLFRIVSFVYVTKNIDEYRSKKVS